MNLNINSYATGNTARSLLAAAVLLCGAVAGKAQQFFSFSQYMNNLAPINHAYSLVDEQGSVSGLFRKQWAGVEGSPSTFIFNGYAPLSKLKASVGGTVMNDHFASENLTEINAFFAKSAQLGASNYLGVSLNAGYRRYTTDYAVRNPGDPVFANDVRQGRMNVGFGVMYYSKDMYLGVSAPQLTLSGGGDKRFDEYAYFRNSYYFSGAKLFDAGDDLKLKPAFLATVTKGIPFVADFSTTAYLKEMIGLGVNYRTNREVAALFSFYTGMLQMGYSYQFGTSGTKNIGTFNSGTHEIMLKYHLGNDKRFRQLL